MTTVFLVSLAAAGIAAITAMLAFPLVARFALATRAVDYPGVRRLQAQATPRMGGIAIVAGIAMGVGLPGLLLWRHWTSQVLPLDLLSPILGTALIFLAGFAEDLIGLSILQRVLVQILAALTVVHAGWSFGMLYVPFWGEIQLGLWGGLATILWIVGVTNALNLLDGLDGLAGGVAAIIATSLLAFAGIQGNALMVVVTASTVGACLGFLRDNWAPARIYMGDSGSLTLGFLLAVMSVHASLKGAATIAILAPILALGLPVIDTLLVMAVRFVAKPHGSSVRRLARMFQADRNHLHHLMARAAPERKHIVLAIYSVAASFCTMAVVVSISRSAALGAALVVIEVLVVLLMRNLGVRAEARSLALLQRREIREDFFAEHGETIPEHGKTQRTEMAG